MNLNFSSEEHILSLNQKAMTQLKLNNFLEAHLTLKETEKLIQNSQCSAQVYNITMSNLGSFFKKTGDLKKALKYFSLCIDRKHELNDPLNLALLYIHQSSVFSSLSDHESSLKSLYESLKVLKTCQKKSKKVIKTEIIAKMNLASELELSNSLEALKIYKEVLQQAKENLGPAHELTKKVKFLFEHSQPCFVKLSRESANRGSFTSSVKLSRDSANRGSFTSSIRKNQTPLRFEGLPTISRSKRSVMSFNESLKARQNPNFDLVWLREPSKRKVISGVNKEEIENISKIIQGIETEKKDKFKIGVSIAKEVMAWQKDFKDILKENFSGNGGKEKDALNKGVQVFKEKEIMRKENNKRKALKENEIVKKVRFRDDIDQKEIAPAVVRRKVRFDKKVCLCLEKDVLESILYIQALAKMRIARRKFLRMKKSSIFIQKNIRRYFVRNLYRKIKNAIVFIQSMVRGHQARKLRKYLKFVRCRI